MEKVNIFIVEDEAIVAKDLSNTLDDLGYSVSGVASTGPDAIRETSKLSPDLVLMDIVLKGPMDGIETASHIFKQKGTPVIFLTAYSDDTILRRARITEPYGYIVKPYNKKELHSAIEIARYKHTMENRLKESEEKYRNLVELANDGVVLVLNDIIEYANPRFSQLCGCPNERLLGSRFSIYINPSYNHKPENRYGFQNWNGIRTYETILCNHNGHTTPIEINAGNVTCRNQQADLLIIRDITDRKRLEEQIVKTEKLESIGILAGGIAHDFNNLLTAILGNASLALEKLQPDENLHKLLSKVQEASIKANVLTQKLITFSNGGNPIKKTTSIIEIIKETVDIALSGTNVSHEYSIPEDLWPVEIDKKQIAQVIYNITVNAKESMPEGGLITVRTQNVLPAEQEKDLLNGSKYINISIQDQGMGISKENMKNIFDPYFSTKQRGAYKGTGLGLSICHSIMKKHGGTITVESEKDKGSIFNIYIPAATRS